MVKFSKEIMQEIIKKCVLRDESGKNVYFKKDLAKEYGTHVGNITAISQGFESYSDYQYHLTKKKWI